MGKKGEKKKEKDEDQSIHISGEERPANSEHADESNRKGTKRQRSTSQSHSSRPGNSSNLRSVEQEQSSVDISDSKYVSSVDEVDPKRQKRVDVKNGQSAVPSVTSCGGTSQTRNLTVEERVTTHSHACFSESHAELNQRFATGLFYSTQVQRFLVVYSVTLYLMSLTLLSCSIAQFVQ